MLINFDFTIICSFTTAKPRSLPLFNFYLKSRNICVESLQITLRTLFTFCTWLLTDKTVQLVKLSLFRSRMTNWKVLKSSSNSSHRPARAPDGMNFDLQMKFLDFAKSFAPGDLPERLCFRPLSRRGPITRAILSIRLLSIRFSFIPFHFLSIYSFVPVSPITLPLLFVVVVVVIDLRFLFSC